MKKSSKEKSNVRLKDKKELNKPEKSSLMQMQSFLEFKPKLHSRSRKKNAASWSTARRRRLLIT